MRDRLDERSRWGVFADVVLGSIGDVEVALCIAGDADRRLRSPACIAAESACQTSAEAELRNLRVAVCRHVKVVETIRGQAMCIRRIRIVAEGAQ